MEKGPLVVPAQTLKGSEAEEKIQELNALKACQLSLGNLGCCCSYLSFPMLAEKIRETE